MRQGAVEFRRHLGLLCEDRVTIPLWATDLAALTLASTEA